MNYFFLKETLIICLPRPYCYLVYIVLCNHNFVTQVACIEVLAVLHVWVSSGSSPEACDHSVLLYVFHRHMCGTFQDQTDR